MKYYACSSATTFRLSHTKPMHVMDIREMSRNSFNHERH